MSRLGSLYIKLGEPDGEITGCCDLSEWAASYIEALTAELAKPDQIDWERKYIAQVALPPGYMLVPEVPTEAMIDKADKLYRSFGKSGIVRIYYAMLQAAKPDPESQRQSCDRHPDAPHGFDRTASHNADRYVCVCESWTPGDAS